MSLQALIDAYFHKAWDRIWFDDRLTVDEKIDRAHAAWLKAAARIKKETGYALT